MQPIKLTKIIQDAFGLTQLSHVCGVNADTVLPTGAEFRTAGFSSTYQASRTGQFLVELGTGKISPIDHSRIVLQLAVDTGDSVAEVIEEYDMMVKRIATDRSIVELLTISVMGSSDRPTRLTNIAPVSSTFLIKRLIEILHGKNASRVKEVLTHLIADSFINVFAKLGLVVKDSPNVHRMRPGSIYPRFQDLVDIMELRSIMATVEHMSNADMSMLTRNSAGRNSSAVSVQGVTDIIASAMTTAYDLARASYDAKSVVVSVLTTLGRIWSPSTPDGLQPSERVIKSSHLAPLQANLALFLATQDMYKLKADETEIQYSDEEMINSILPIFTETMNLISPYKQRLLADSVNFFGLASSRDHEGVPGSLFLYEEWMTQGEITAFQPVRQSANSKSRFLIPKATVSAAMTTALKPVQSVVSITNVIRNKVDTADLTEISKRAASGSSIQLLFPSMQVRESLEELMDPQEDDRQDDTMARVEAVRAFIVTGQTPSDGVMARLGVSLSELQAIQYDYYASLMHLATRVNSNVSIGRHDGSDEPLACSGLYLKWDIEVNLKKQISVSARLNGMVRSTEPLEVIGYQPDITPTSSLSVDHALLEDHKRSLHLWDWYRYSSNVEISAQFIASIRNRKFNIVLDEREMLALGVRRERTRFLTPDDTAALVSLWLREIISDYKEIKKGSQKAKDRNVKALYNGSEIKMATQIIHTLMQVAASSTGERIVNQVMAKMADQISQSDNQVYDILDDMQAGVQRHKLHIWAGIRILELLQLISSTEAKDVADIISDSDALDIITTAPLLMDDR